MEILAKHGCTFPMRLLFTKEPKLQLNGFRWAPTAFMAFKHEDINYLKEKSEMLYTSFTDRGLLINGIGAWTLLLVANFKKVTYAEVEKSIFAFTAVPIGKSCRDAEGYLTPKVLNEALEINPAQHWSPDMQAMLGKSPGTTAVLFGGPFGMLVSIYDSDSHAGDPDGSLIYARPIGQLHIRMLKTASQNFSTFGANSSQVKVINPTWTVAGTEKEMQEALIMAHDPETSTFLH